MFGVSNFLKRFRKVRCLFYSLFLLIGIFLLTGCGVLETLVKDEGETTPLADWIGNTTAGSAESIPATSNLGDGKAVFLYFPDTSGKALVKEERTIPKTLSLARETVTQWLTGPAASGNAQKPVNPATTLLDIGIKEGVAVVDLSREFTEPYGGVSQEVAVYGLVNTLTQFPTVHEVKIRIEGRELTQLGGVDLSNLSYREGFIKGVANGNESAQPNAGADSKTDIKDSEVKESPSSLNLFGPSASS